MYQTVVMDLDTRRIIYVAEGRAKECLDSFWRKVKAQKAKIKAVAMDMWPAYIGAVTEHLPDADIIYDTFHIFKNMGKTLSSIRKQLYRDETDLNKKKVMKGTRWLLLYNQENLHSSGKEKLDQALKMNLPLAQAYYLKESLRDLWNQINGTFAEIFIEQWCQQAEATGLTLLKKFAKSLKAHRTGILNWYKHHISTGPLEGMNNKIKVLKRKAYGYRDIEFFNLKILDLHTTRYALI